MKATEARIRAIEVNNLADNREKNTVLGDIKDKADKGEFELFIYKSLRPAVKKVLEDMGYIITVNNGITQQDVTTKIFWK